jgi:spore coat protein H
LLSSGSAQSSSHPKKSADLFKTTAIWNVHLTFTAEDWAAMEPKGGGPGFGGPMGGRRLDAATFLEPGFLKGDTNGDGKLSRDEFAALGTKLFSEWDTQKAGSLSADQLRAGISTAFPFPAFGPGGPGAPGGAGGRGPGGPGGMNFTAREGARNGLSGMSGVDFQYVKANLDFEGRSYKDVAVRYKGNSSFMMARGTDKRSLKIDLNEYVKGQKLAGLSTINLHNAITDGSWMNEVLSYRLFRDAGVPAPRTAYARVYITVDGKWEKKYIGLYELVENVDKTFSEEHYDGAQGAIFKPATRTLFEHQGDDWSKYKQAYDPKTSLSAIEKQRVINFAKLVSSASDDEFRARLDKYLDIEEFARFMAVTTWLANLDSILSMGQNYYVYLHPKTMKFQFLPWDLDHSFGQFPMGGSQEQREKLNIHQPWSGQNKFMERVFAVPAFKKVYLARLADLQKSLAKPDRLMKQVDEVAAAIRPAIQEESAEKLARFDKLIAGETVSPPAFGPGPGGGGGPRPGGFGGGPAMGAMGAGKPIKAFVPARSQAVADQLAGKPERLPPSGPGGPGRGPGGPAGFGPAMMLQPVFTRALDADKDGSISRDEFQRGFEAWFTAWNADNGGILTAEQLRAGINKDLAMPAPGGGGMMPFGPGGPPPPPRP